uniref:Uncharacterized protein n=1 Tax=Glossina pallidipes TaxID=7398 RepID=A0A1B0ACA3_GLOPL
MERRTQIRTTHYVQKQKKSQWHSSATSAVPEISAFVQNSSWSVLETFEVRETIVQVTDTAANAVTPKYSFIMVKFFCSGNVAVASSILNSSTQIHQVKPESSPFHE